MIIGLSGFARAGKDTVADYLVAKHGFVKLSFATPMREALYNLNPFITVADMTRVPLATAVDGLGWENLKADSPDIRPLMQRLGTEVGRKMFGEDFWVNLAVKEAAKYEKIVFADARFKNEADAIRNGDGYIWRINRPGFEAANDHISEHDLDDYTFDTVINNNLDLESLHTFIEKALEV